MTSHKLFLLLAALTLHAQQTTPHAGYVYPAGGRLGDTVDVIVGGQFLDGVNGVIVSGGGVHASLSEYVKPLTQGQYNKLRDQLQELMDKKKAGTAWTPTEEKTVADIRMKMATFIRRPMSPAIAETVRLQIKLVSRRRHRRARIAAGHAQRGNQPHGLLHGPVAGVLQATGQGGE